MKVIQPLRDIGTALVDLSGPLPFVGVQAAFDEFFQRGTLRSYLEVHVRRGAHRSDPRHHRGQGPQPPE